MKNHSIGSIREALLKKEFSAAEFTREALEHAERENPKTNAYLTFASVRAMAAAEEVDRKIAAGEDPGALAGVPVAVKDVIVTKGLRTTCGSGDKRPRPYRPDRSRRVPACSARARWRSPRHCQ